MQTRKEKCGFLPMSEGRGIRRMSISMKKKFFRTAALLLAIGMYAGGAVGCDISNGIVGAKAKEESVNEMEQIAMAIESTFLQSKERILEETGAEAWHERRDAWQEILSAVEPEDLKPQEGEVLKYGGLVCNCAICGLIDLSFFQYSSQRVDPWGMPYLITVIDWGSYDPGKYGIFVLSAGRNKKYFYAQTLGVDGKPVPDDPTSPNTIAEPDDICFLSMVDEEFNFTHASFTHQRRDNLAYEEFYAGKPSFHQSH